MRTGSSQAILPSSTSIAIEVDVKVFVSDPIQNSESGVTAWLPPDIARDEHGFVVTGTDFESSVPGVFAIGDVRSQSVKRVASAVGEGSVAIQHVHRYLEAAR